jgi:hypothetical protein
MDSLAITRKLGRFDLFITITCNPKWPEIQKELKKGQTYGDRPDIVNRVFNIKFKQMFADIKDGHVFGRTESILWVKE